MTDTFQSNGLCFDNCKAKYAFAVVQGSRCWCSDYVPASSTTGCDETCPGYGQESCGNTKKGLFGYISLPNAPKGTAGASSSTVRESESLAPSTPLNFLRLLLFPRLLLEIFDPLLLLLLYSSPLVYSGVGTSSRMWLWLLLQGVVWLS